MNEWMNEWITTKQLVAHQMNEWMSNARQPIPADPCPCRPPPGTHSGWLAGPGALTAGPRSSVQSTSPLERFSAYSRPVSVDTSKMLPSSTDGITAEARSWQWQGAVRCGGTTVVVRQRGTYSCALILSLLNKRDSIGTMLWAIVVKALMSSSSPFQETMLCKWSQNLISWIFTWKFWGAWSTTCRKCSKTT